MLFKSDTLVSGRESKVKMKENILMAATIERVPEVLSGEASSMGNNCTGMNAASHSAPEVNETATPVNIIFMILASATPEVDIDLVKGERERENSPVWLGVETPVDIIITNKLALVVVHHPHPLTSAMCMHTQSLFLHLVLL